VGGNLPAMIDLSVLNPEQRLAASTAHGPVLILAGAGSGKTRTVTYRIAHMIDNLRIDPKEILAVSFTNKAATEMRERVRSLLGPRKTRGIILSTFHSLGIRILREDIDKLGYSKDFTIYDQADQLSIIREGLKQLKAGKDTFDKKTILSKIGFLKNSGISATEYSESNFFDPESQYDIATEHCYHYYQDKLQFYNALDFDDILFLIVKLFQAHPEVAQKYSTRFKYIMIDEYQDTNGLQFEMVKGLTSVHHNLCVVGDDDQSIYAFRGADISNILNFEKIYPNTKVIKLEQNYRSSQEVLTLANAVIKNNRQRTDKTMRTEFRSGVTPKLWSCANTDHEAQIVIDEIIKHQREGKFLGDIAILYRSNTQVPPFEDQLRLSQVPYHIIGGQKFYDKKEIKDLIAYLSVIFNPKDELSLRRIINVPNRGLGTATLKSFLAISQNANIPLIQVIEQQAISSDENKKSEKLRAFTELIQKYRGYYHTMGLVKATQALITEIDYFAFIDKSYDSPKISRFKKDDVQNFLISTERFADRFREEATLGNYLERLLLADAHDRSNNEEGTPRNEVTLMTLHSSKGLEFEKVFLIGMEEELLPHKNTIKEGTDIDEERRLAYVGITRAKSDLIMTYANERKLYGKQIPRFRSRFLEEIDEATFTFQDRNSFGHMSAEELQDYKSNFFGDLLKSID